MLQFTEYIQYNETQILQLYASVGWSNYTDRRDMLRAAYSNSLYALAAYDENTLVGIIRAVGDGASIIYIQDLLVLPLYQRQGIGRKLVKKVMDKYKDAYQLVLLTEAVEKNIAFYQSLRLK
jgi:GNAT superfamily N-acetyltransferase